MEMYPRYKSPLGYMSGDNRIDSYGVNHSGFTTRDELEYQVARQKRENQLIQNYNQQGITGNYPQYGTNFWGNPENNYGFGDSNIQKNIENMQNQTPTPWAQSNTGWGNNDLAKPDNPVYKNQNTEENSKIDIFNSAIKDLNNGIKNIGNNIADNVELAYNIFQAINPRNLGANISKYINDIDFRNNERHKLLRTIEEPTNLVFSLTSSNTPKEIPNYQQEENIQSLNGNMLNANERINAYKTNKDIYINIAEKEKPEFKTFPYHDEKSGQYYVEKYSPLIEKYAKENNLNPNIAKAILFSEASDYHDEGLNRLGDIAGKIPFLEYFLEVINKQPSTSIWPMNIQEKTWSDFQGKHYNVYNPEQNIALSTKLLKAISDSVPDKDIAKIATLWNNTRAKQISDYGARTQHYYDNRMWDKHNRVK